MTKARFLNYLRQIIDNASDKEVNMEDVILDILSVICDYRKK